MTEKRQPAPEKTTKTAYGTPQLQVYGNLREITQTVTIAAAQNLDGGGNHTATH